MKTETTNYIDEATRATLNPRYVLALSFDDDNTDITYITSHADCLDPGGVASIDRIDGAMQPDGISGQTQRIAPENAQHTIGSVSFKILDVGGALTTKINTKLTGGEGLRHKRVRLYKGFAGLTSWDDYALRLTYRIEDVQYMDGVYTFSTGDIQRQAKTKIFEPHQGVLTSTLTASATTVPITIANAQEKFPLVYHDSKWDAHINQAVGYIQIDDEIIAHSGWTDATYTALTVVQRGALGTVAVEHEVTATEEDQKKKVDEYIYLQMQSPRMAYALLTGLDVPATNLISDVAKFSEFTETGSGVLVETADVGPVPWVNWFDVIDDAATYETANFTITDFTVNQIYTASVAIKNDAAKTKNLYLRITFLGATAGSYAEIRLKMSTGVTASTTTAADATTVSTDAELINGFWVLRVSASCSNPSASSIMVSMFPAVDTGGAAETQTIQAALPFFAEGEHAGMFPLPEHWHLGIHADYTRLADFTGIGADLWDTTNNTGRVARFMGIDGETGKAFIEKELLLWMGAYMPVHADGTLGLRRLKSVLPYAGYDAYLDSTQIIRYGALRYDQSAVINDISIEWNWIDTLDRYTKTTRLFDSNSISLHGTAAQKTYEFRGVFNGVHTDSDLQNYFENIRDRYSAPPLRLQIDVMPQWDKIEVGDTVRVDLSQHVDYHIDDTLSRTFEVQQVRTDWITGKVSLTLFGGVEAAAQDAIATSFVLSDTFYGSSGSLGGTDLTSVLTISGGAITANGSLTGGDYYYDGGDLTLNSGITITISGTVRLRVKGFFTVNGTIDGVGGGAAGGAGGTITNGTYTPDNIIDAYRANAPANGTSGAFGSNTPSLSSFRNERTNDGVKYARSSLFFTLLNVPTIAKTSANVINIINPDGLSLTGISEIDDLTGSGGGGSAAAFDLVMGAGTWPVTQLSAGSAGGSGGAGLCLITRGISFGAAGQIDVSGAAGSVGGSGVSDGDTFYAASGTSGWPGAVYILLDGDVATPDTSKIITKTGNSSIPSASKFLTRGAPFSLLSANNDTYALSYFGSAVYDHPNKSHRDQLRIQYIPRALNGFTWYPAQEAREVTGYENKPPEWDQIADSAGLKPANNATVNNIYRLAAASPPSTPVSGDVWYQTDTGRLQSYDGASWQPAATQNLVTRAGSAPSTPQVGDLWIDTSGGSSTEVVQVYDGSTWQDMATNGATAGANLRDAAANLIGDADVLNSYNVLTSAITVTVGSGGDYATINAALVGLTQQFPTYQSTAARATINILSGTQLTQQVIVDGIDLSWITITSVDATVVENITGTVPSVTPLASGTLSRPIFAAINGGRFPVIDIKIQVNNTTSGIIAFLSDGAGSQIQFQSGTGNGAVYNSSAALSYGVVARSCGMILSLLNEFTGFDTNAYAVEAGNLNLLGSDLSDAASYGIRAEFNAVVLADTVNMDNAGDYGVSASESSLVNCRNSSIDNAGINAVIASANSNVSCESCSIDSPGDSAINSRSSHISAISTTVTNVTTGHAYQVALGGVINASGTTGTVSKTANIITADGLIYQ